MVVATSRQRRRRTPLWRGGLLFCVCVVERVLCVCILALGHSPAAAWLFTAAAYLLRYGSCNDHGRRKEKDPSPSDWNTLPSEPSDPSHCLLGRATRSRFLPSRKKCLNGSSTKIQGAPKTRLPKMDETRFKVAHACFCGLFF